MAIARVWVRPLRAPPFPVALLRAEIARRPYVYWSSTERHGSGSKIEDVRDDFSHLRNDGIGSTISKSSAACPPVERLDVLG